MELIDLSPNVHTQIHNFIWDTLVKISSQLIYLYDTYQYDDFVYDDDDYQGLYIMCYQYDYLQPNNIFDIDIEATINKFVQFIKTNFMKRLIDLNDDMYYLISFNEFKINNLTLRIKFNYKVIFKDL